jgi:hypothetical protein
MSSAAAAAPVAKKGGLLGSMYAEKPRRQDILKQQIADRASLLKSAELLRAPPPVVPVSTPMQSIFVDESADAETELRPPVSATTAALEPVVVPAAASETSDDEVADGAAEVRQKPARKRTKPKWRISKRLKSGASRRKRTTSTATTAAAAATTTATESLSLTAPGLVSERAGVDGTESSEAESEEEDAVVPPPSGAAGASGSALRAAMAAIQATRPVVSNETLCACCRVDDQIDGCAHARRHLLHTVFAYRYLWCDLFEVYCSCARELAAVEALGEREIDAKIAAAEKRTDMLLRRHGLGEGCTPLARPFDALLGDSEVNHHQSGTVVCPRVAAAVHAYARCLLGEQVQQQQQQMSGGLVAGFVATVVLGGAPILHELRNRRAGANRACGLTLAIVARDFEAAAPSDYALQCFQQHTLEALRSDLALRQEHDATYFCAEATGRFVGIVRQIESGAKLALERAGGRAELTEAAYSALEFDLCSALRRAVDGDRQSFADYLVPFAYSSAPLPIDCARNAPTQARQPHQMAPSYMYSPTHHSHQAPPPMVQGSPAHLQTNSSPSSLQGITVAEMFGFPPWKGYGVADSSDMTAYK